MRFSSGFSISLGLFVLMQLHFQLSLGAEISESGAQSGLQKNLEELIEKIFNYIKNYYTNIRNIYKCIPDKVAEPTKEIVLRSMDCLADVEKKLDWGLVTKKVYRKLFLGCLGQGKKQVENLMSNINSTLDLCPQNVTEKTYQVDVSTLLRKALDVNIDKGFEIIRKTIVFEAKESNLKDVLEEHSEEDEYEEEEEDKTKNTPEEEETVKTGKPEMLPEEEEENYTSNADVADEEDEDDDNNYPDISTGNKRAFSPVERPSNKTETKNDVSVPEQRNNQQEDGEEDETKIGLNGKIST